MTEKRRKDKIAWPLWLPVILAFLLLIGAWGTLIWIAAEHPTDRIEVESAE